MSAHTHMRMHHKVVAAANTHIHVHTRLLRLCSNEQYSYLCIFSKELRLLPLSFSFFSFLLQYATFFFVFRCISAVPKHAALSLLTH